MKHPQSQGRIFRKGALSMALIFAFVIQPFLPLTVFAGGINVAPSAPTLSGFNVTGTPNTSYSFSAQSTDPDGDSIEYGFDWDNDGVIDEYTSIAPSGTAGTISHSWSGAGSYTVSVYARDPWSAVSSPSTATFTVSSAGGGNNGGSNPPVNVAPSAPTVGGTTGTANSALTLSAVSTDPEGDNILYGFDWNNDGVVDEYTSAVSSGTSASISHTWNSAGTYTVPVIARDIWNAISNPTNATVTINPSVPQINVAPSTPTVSVQGTTAGSPSTFTVLSTDPEGDQVNYGFDWDNDGVVDEYTGLVNSGTQAQLANTWQGAGSYTIKVYAKDVFNNFSNPSTFTANITAGGSGPVVNTAPNVPDVNGPLTGIVNTSYDFSIAAVDPQGDDVLYGFDWDNDGVIDEYSSTTISGVALIVSHTWTTPGAITFKAYAKDVWNAVSNPKTYNISIIQAGGGGQTGSFSMNPALPAVTGENGSTSAFTVVLGSAPSSNVILPVQSSDTTEGTVSTTTLLFTPSDWNTPQTVIVTGVDDAIVDGDVSYNVTLGPSQSADSNFDLLSAQSIGFVNLDNDSNNGGGGNNGGSISSFTVNPATITSGGTTTLSWASTNSSVCVASGAWTGTKPTTGTEVVGPFVPVSAQDILTFTLNCGNSNGTSTQSVTLTINSSNNGGNPSGDFTINAAPNLTTSENGATAVFTVVLNAAPLADVTFPVSSSNFNEGTTSPITSLTFTPSNWNVSQTVTVTGVDDRNLDGNTAYTVSVGPSTSADVNWNGIPAKTVSFTNIDNETATGGSSSGGGGGRGGGGSSGGPCYGFNCPTTGTSTPSSGVNPNDILVTIGGGTSNGTRGVSTAVTGPELVCPRVNLITTFLRAGIDNDQNEVRKLQYFLNTYENAGLPIDGVFGTSTEAAVRAYQAKYSADILAPWGVTEPTGVVYITTTRKINSVYCGDNPTYNGNDDLKDILNGNVLNIPVDNSGQFEGQIGAATTSTSTLPANIAGVFGAISSRVLDIFKNVPWYPLLILLLIILGAGFIIQASFIKDIKSPEAYTILMRGAALLAIGSVLNVLNTLSFIINSKWLEDKMGLSLPWLLGLDMVNVIGIAAICLSLLVALHKKISGGNPTLK